MKRLLIALALAGCATAAPQRCIQIEQRQIAQCPAKVTRDQCVALDKLRQDALAAQRAELEAILRANDPTWSGR